MLAPLDGTVHSFADNNGRLDYGPTIILEHEIEGGLKFFTLYGHLTGDSLSGLAKGRIFKKGKRIGTIGENGGWPPHLHFQIVTDLLGKSGDFPGVAVPSQREVWLSLSPDPNFILKIPGPSLHPQRRPRDSAEILDLRSRHLGPSLSVTYKRPLKIVRGHRQYLYDESGQAYLDAVNNVPHVGHCHPRVIRAAQEQIAVLNTNTRYLHDNIVEYALRLKEKLPDPLGVFFFVCSGSEANDLALRLAWTHTQKPAAFICESLMSSAGVIEFPQGYLAEAFRHVRRTGAICIADEVQVGFGRLGTHFWGFDTQGVIPDIVTMGKPIGNGHPLAAVVTTPEIAASFKTGMEYFNTFGGNPVSCAVGLAVLDVLEEEKLQLNAFEVGRLLRTGLERLKGRHPLIGDVRGRGLFIGIELVLDRLTLEPAAAEAAYVAERMKDKGVLISPEGPRHNVLKIRPPLVIEKADVDRLIDSLDQVLGEDALTF